MTAEQRDQASAMKAVGETNAAIAEHFGVSEATIRRWLKQSDRNGTQKEMSIRDWWPIDDAARRTARSRLRTLVRLKHTAAADQEIAALLPKTERVLDEIASNAEIKTRRLFRRWNRVLVRAQESFEKWLEEFPDGPA
jgi:transcription initiation factor TFIIIB Brf1 subunit/transcription initiation factor TFIIB